MSTENYRAFANEKQVASGNLTTLLTSLKPLADEQPGAPILVFEDGTGRQVDFDLRGDLSQVLERAGIHLKIGPGRPKLGVVSREISLLPRHWEWLERRPNGASATIRRLIEDASKGSNPGEARDRTSRVMTALAGNFPGYEDAGRALYRGDRTAFEELVSGWPSDIRNYLIELAGPAFGLTDGLS